VPQGDDRVIAARRLWGVAGSWPPPFSVNVRVGGIEPGRVEVHGRYSVSNSAHAAVEYVFESGSAVSHVTLRLIRDVGQWRMRVAAPLEIRVGVSRLTVNLWRERYATGGIAALVGEPRSGERQTYDYLRHSTPTLFAAPEVATGKVTDTCDPRHPHQEFLRFLTQVAKAYPSGAAASGAGQPRHPPTPHGPRLVGAHPTDHAALHPPPRGRQRPHHRHSSFIDGWNERRHPLTWTRTANQILEHVELKKREKLHSRDTR
jgi:hypothetical protein